MKTSLIRILVTGIFIAVGFIMVAAHAEELGAVKARMSQRLAKIDALKAAGAAGENNRGLLELRGSEAGAGEAIAAENRDRETVYAEIAKQTGASAEQVGRKRAHQIAAASAAGVWLQQDDGTWYKK